MASITSSTPGKSTLITAASEMTLADEGSETWFTSTMHVREENAATDEKEEGDGSGSNSDADAAADHEERDAAGAVEESGAADHEERDAESDHEIEEDEFDEKLATVEMTLSLDDEDLLPKDSVAALSFWQELASKWLELYPQLMNGPLTGRAALDGIHSMLGTRLASKLEFEVTVGQCNLQRLQEYEKHIELYISPRMQRENIVFMKALYDCRVEIPRLIVACYAPWNVNAPTVAAVRLVDGLSTLAGDVRTAASNGAGDDAPTVLAYEDIGYLSNPGFDTSNPLARPRALINIALMINPKLVPYVLESRTVSFAADKKTSRKVLVPTDGNALTIFLLAMVGEYNMLNRIGYIEYLNGNDPITDGSTFHEYSDIRADIRLVEAQNGRKPVCGHCGHSKQRVDLLRCACTKVWYCNTICQRAEWSVHSKAVVHSKKK